MSSIFRSFRIRNYRIWFVAAFASNVGGWMQSTTVSWVVLTQLSESNSALAVGYTFALQFGPPLLLTPLVGVILDKFDRKIILFFTQATSAILATGVGLLLLYGHAELWHIYLFTLILGIINAFDSPAKTTFVSDMVDDNMMSNAVALNSASFNGARLIGPAVAGVLLVIIGAGWVFLLNAISFFIVFMTLFTIHRGQMIKQYKPNGKVTVRDGLRYIKVRHDLPVILFMVFMVGSFAMNLAIFTSTMAVEYDRGAGEFGLVNSVLAIGSLAGALLAARRERARARIVVISSGMLTVSLGVWAFMPSFEAFAVVSAFVGFSAVSTLVTANGYVQTTTAAQFRGRVMAIYMGVLLGGTPVGAPIVGLVADTYGPRWAIWLGAAGSAIACIVGFIWLMVAQHYRIRFHPESHWRLVLTRDQPADVAVSPNFNDTIAFTAPIAIPKLLPPDTGPIQIVSIGEPEPLQKPGTVSAEELTELGEAEKQAKTGYDGVVDDKA